MVWSRAGIYSAYYRARMAVSKKKPGPEAVKKAKRVLVIAQSGIGNMILTLPLIETIAKRLDHPRVDVLVSPRGGADLLKGLKYINEVIVSNDPKFLEPKERKALFETIGLVGYDMTVTSYACNSVESALISAHSGAKIRAGHSSNARIRPDRLYNFVAKRDPARHEVQLNLDLARAMGLEPVTEEPRMAVSDKELEWAKGFLKAAGVPDNVLIIGFHPGCHKDMPYKRWKGFSELGRMLIKDKDAWVIVMGGPDEKELCGGVVSGIGKGAVLAAGKASLRQTAALMRCCKAFVTNDSGLMHLAQAAGTPVVAIFGPTDRRRTSPAGKNVLVHHDLGCGPCYVNPSDTVGCKEIKCLEGIKPDEVMSALDVFIGKA